MTNFLKLLFLTLLLCSCTTSKKVIRDNRTTQIDTIVINNTSVVTDFRTDTIHDSVFVKEIVTEQGEIKYKERIVYRDRIKNVAKENRFYNELYG